MLNRIHRLSRLGRIAPSAHRRVRALPAKPVRVLRGSASLQQLGRQPLLDQDPRTTLKRGPYDAALPTGRGAPPLQQDSGEPAMTVGHPTVLQNPGGRLARRRDTVDPLVK